MRTDARLFFVARAAMAAALLAAVGAVATPVGFGGDAGHNRDRSIPPSPSPAPVAGAPSQALGRLPVRFEPNRGQADRRVRFTARNGGRTLFLTDDEAVLVLPAPATPGAASPVVRMSLVGSRHSDLEAMGRLPGLAHYLAGTAGPRAVTAVPGYASVARSGVYRGVDLVYHAERGGLEYDFVVAPGADPSSITVGLAGVERVTVGDAGELVMATPAGEVRQPAPQLYQEIGGRRRPVPGSYRLGEHARVGFSVGPYDHRHALVIDPELAFATYLGGGGEDEGRSIALDGAGNIYVAGKTESDRFPALDSPPRPAVSTGFVTKLDPSGSKLVYAAYVPVENGVRDLAVDPAGHAFVVGAGGDKALVAKLNPAGSGYAYRNTDWAMGNFEGTGPSAVAIDGAGNAYVTGSVKEAGLATPGAFMSAPPRPGDQANVFVAKLNASGQVGYFTYFGGDRAAFPGGIAVDRHGTVSFAGMTNGGIPVKKAFKDTQDGVCGGQCTDAFAARLDPRGQGSSDLVYSTYLGGQWSDWVVAVAVDDDGNAYLTGTTQSPDFPRSANGWPAPAGNGAAAFVTRIPAGGSGGGGYFSTVLGSKGGGTYTSPGSRGDDLAIGTDGMIHVVGGVFKDDVRVTPDAFQPVDHSPDGSDAFIAVLDPTRPTPEETLVYSTYFGAQAPPALTDHSNLSVPDDVGALGVAIGECGSVFFTGFTDAVILPTKNAYDDTLNGGRDAFVAAFAPKPVVDAVTPQKGPTSGGTAVVIKGSGFTKAAGGVSFGETPATSFTVTSCNEVRAVSPPHAAGTVHVRVNALGDYTKAATLPGGVTPPGGVAPPAVPPAGGPGDESTTDLFEYSGPPTVSAVEPRSGPEGGGQKVKVTGTGLAATTAVSFGTARVTATPCPPAGGTGASPCFTVVSPGEVAVYSPAHPPGTVHVTVTAPGGTSGETPADAYDFVANPPGGPPGGPTTGAPTVTAVDPSSGPSAGATEVKVAGTGLATATTVSFGTTAVTAAPCTPGVRPTGATPCFDRVSDSLLVVWSPAHPAGAVHVTVTTPAGSSTANPADVFSFEDPAVTGDGGPEGTAPAGSTGRTFPPPATPPTGTAPAPAHAPAPVTAGSGAPSPVVVANPAPVPSQVTTASPTAAPAGAAAPGGASASAPGFSPSTAGFGAVRSEEARGATEHAMSNRRNQPGGAAVPAAAAAAGAAVFVCLLVTGRRRRPDDDLDDSHAWAFARS